MIKPSKYYSIHSDNTSDSCTCNNNNIHCHSCPPVLRGSNGLRGKQGPPGRQGPPGKQGDPGTPGTSFLIGNGPPTCDTPSNIGDTYVDLNSGEIYSRVDGSPIAPTPMDTPDPTSSDIQYVTSSANITTAINNVAPGGTVYFKSLIGGYIIPSSITINKSLTLTGDAGVKLIGSNVLYMFLISSSNVIIKDLYFEINYNTQADPRVFDIQNNLISNIFVDNCTFVVSESAFYSKAINLQVINSKFYYANPGLGDQKYRYFLVSNLTGTYIFYNNQFQAGAGDRRQEFVNLTNSTASDMLSGTIALLNNTQVEYSDSLNYNTRYFLALESGSSYVSNLKIFINHNYISSNGNIPIYFGVGTNLDTIAFISANINTSLGNYSSGFKGFIGLDELNMPGTTSLFASDNTIIPSSGWNIDFLPLYDAPNENLVGYLKAGDKPNLVLNPPGYCWQDTGYKLDIQPS